MVGQQLGSAKLPTQAWLAGPLQLVGRGLLGAQEPELAVPGLGGPAE